MGREMDKDTLKAVKDSIKRWKDIAAGEAGEEDSDCPLCNLFPGFSCGGCPVRDATGQSMCWETPYTEWFSHINNNHSGKGWRVHCPECKEIALKEVAFIEGLLPTAAGKGGA